MKHIFFACALFVTFLSSCTDETSDFTPVQPGEGIKFAASSVTNARTIYDDENIFQINWQDQDAIKIYCNKKFDAGATPGVNVADYKVKPNETAGEEQNKLYNTGTIEPAGSAQLQWADNAEHKFIAVYPYNNPNIKVNTANGNITFPINRNQVCEAVKVEKGGYYSSKYGNYTYYAKPDMNNAFLAAYTSTTPDQAVANNGDVFLGFKPVMTTIEVVVKGPKTENQTSKITGISIGRRVPKNTDGVYESFIWNAEKGAIPYNPTDAQLPDEKDPSQWTVENTFVGLATPVELKTGETIVFTAFIPPLRIGGNKLAMKVRVHATGSNEVVSKLITNEILPSNKRRITLDNIKVDDGNNWMTPLDDNIFINQLSIPGSHDATTGETMATAIGKGFAKTQELPILDQWKLGVRCFDMRVAIYTGGAKPELWFYHGPTRVKVGWQKVMDDITSQLNAHRGEFAIFLLRHENEGAVNKDENADNFNKMMTDWLVNANKDKELFINWRPDLTVGDCRGKILLVSRFNGSWTPGAYLTWPDNTTGSSTIYSCGDRTVAGNLIVQDYYKSTGDKDYGVVHHEVALENKYKRIIDMFNRSETAYKNGDMVSLINHVSGYPYTTSSDRYAENAEYQNPQVYEYLKTRTTQGPTGIVLCDYSGAYSIKFWGDRIVKGDLLLQEVINTNYKYRMHRKGETLKN